MKGVRESLGKPRDGGRKEKTKIVLTRKGKRSGRVPRVPGSSKGSVELS